ncbi:alpha/beta fold hydrolase [Corynebacterium provencense]|uniref:alpha/beta fold hydrolase n=1 Tax=Corynebacterium provencense TaxID=1737425 RepID=UPI00082B46A2|nr:alpha/beta fold hydrolase [Corynebacterium provencense]
MTDDSRGTGDRTGDATVPDRPATPLELTVAGAWSARTGVEPVLPDDRFSELGGTSMDVEVVLVELRTALGRDIDASLMADDPTLATLAHRIEERGRRDFLTPSDTCTHLTPGAGDLPKVFCFAGAGASAVTFFGLATALTGVRDLWAFHAHGFHSRGLPDRTLAAHGRRHTPRVTELQPDGPVTLVGHSFGGHVALEVARRLLAEGRVVDRIVLLDTVLDGAGGSVANFADSPVAGPPLRERLRTHWRIATAGIIPRDVRTQHDVFWEQAVRVQNRIRLTDVPDRTVVLVTDENARQEALWRALDGPLEVRRVTGSHLDLLSQPEPLSAVVDAVTGPPPADTDPH